MEVTRAEVWNFDVINREIPHDVTVTMPNQELQGVKYELQGQH